MRELANAVERLMILYPDSPIAAEEVGTVLPRRRPLASAAVEDDEDASLSDLLERYERRLIERALGDAAGNIAEAARRLSTDRPNLYRRMKRLEIDWQEAREEPEA